ncbi:MAG: hypothetical protein IJ327_00885 [Lachnospiraceae bacterium]|nr:hypothetical protein [Lachnospiraceae bacterium]
MKALLVLNLIFPLVMILVAHILKKSPVWDMGSHQGYNTPSSRLSQTHWNYAQTKAPEYFLSMGKCCLLAEVLWSLISLLPIVDLYISLWIGGALGLAALVVAFCKTEKDIRQNCPIEDAK